MIRAIPATSAPRNRRINCGKLVFSLPLVGYCFIAILVAFHPPAPWVVAILGSPLVLVAFAVNRRALQRATGWGCCTRHGPGAGPAKRDRPDRDVVWVTGEAHQQDVASDGVTHQALSSLATPMVIRRRPPPCL
jgi:hypothetical protein